MGKGARLPLGSTSAALGGALVLWAIRYNELRVLNRYPQRELPVKLQSTAYTWSQVRAFRRLYAQTRQEWPRGLLDD